MKLTAERIKEVMFYDADTGILLWIKKTSPKGKDLNGKAAGSLRPDGYLTARIDGVSYLVHRMVWLYFYGNAPSGVIDHINGIRTDNRIRNLRDCTHAINRQNVRKANGNSRFLGVSWCKREGKFRASIKLNRKMFSLGYFNTEEQARDAYINAKEKLHVSAPEMLIKELRNAH